MFLDPVSSEESHYHCHNVYIFRRGLGHMHAKRDKERDAHGEKTPKKDVIITVIRRTFYLSKIKS